MWGFFKGKVSCVGEQGHHEDGLTGNGVTGRVYLRQRSHSSVQLETNNFETCT